MTSPVPVTSVSRPGQLAAPAAALARLVPDQIVDSLDSKIYWFKKGGTDSGPYQGRRARASGTDFAMLVVPHSGGTFRVQYYPKDGAAQIVAELPTDKLPLIIQDLVDAGFPVVAAPKHHPPISFQPVAEKTGTPVLTENTQVRLLPG